MQVRVSKKMLSVLSKELKKEFPEYSISYYEFPVNYYQRYVDRDIWNHEIDYIESKNRLKAFQIDYPSEYYALPRFITTNDLVKMFKNSKGTMESFLYEFLRTIEI